MNKHFKQLASIKIQLMSHAKLWKTFYLAVLLIYTTHCWQFFHMLYYKELFAQKPHLFLREVIFLQYHHFITILPSLQSFTMWRPGVQGSEYDRRN
jgi:hypothetical protein